MSFLLSADDLGATAAINESVLKAFRFGTLQSASLMMGEDHTQDAVKLAKANPGLRVGLHLTFVDGKSVLPYSEIPDLVDLNRNFPRDPAYTWLKYFFNRKLRIQLEKEVHAQFEAFAKTGLPLSHVDGHHHQHIHPSIYKLVVKLSQIHKAQWIRLPRENLGAWKNAASEPTFLKHLLGLIYFALTLGKRKFLREQGFQTFEDVSGFLETYSMSKEYVLKILEMNPPGMHEFYFHPGREWNHDLDVLMDPEVKEAVRKFSVGSLSSEMH